MPADSHTSGPPSISVRLGPASPYDDEVVWEPQDKQRVAVPEKPDFEPTVETVVEKTASEPNRPKEPRRQRNRFIPEVPVATVGFWGWWWSVLQPLYARYGWKWLIVSPSVSEWKLGITKDAESKQLKTMTANKKGGPGKTSVSTAVGSILAWITQQDVLLIDANQTKGNTASRIGVKQTLSFRKTLRALSTMDTITRAWAVRHFSRHPAAGYGSLRVMTSDGDSEWDTPLTFDDVMKVYTEAKKAHHSLVIDCGNTVEGEVVRTTMEYCDVPIFVARERQENSMTDCRDTIVYFKRTMKEKVANGVVVVVGHRRGDSSIKNYAELFGMPTNRIILIPDDPFYRPIKVKNVKDSDDLIKVFMAQNLRRSTFKAYCRLIRLLFSLQPAIAGEPDFDTEESFVDSPT